MKTDTIVKFGAVSCILMTAVLAAGFWLMPEFGKPTMDSAKLALDTAVPAAGAANIVCAIVLDIRGYDTLGEATLLFAAVTGVVVLLSGKGGEKDQQKQVASLPTQLAKRVEAPVMKLSESEPIPIDRKPPWVKDA
jgi:hypothetical protein